MLVIIILIKDFVELTMDPLVYKDFATIIICIDYYLHLVATAALRLKPIGLVRKIIIIELVVVMELAASLDLSTHFF
jgi:hypothetical protein